jgi:hypothetical protein
LSLRQVHCYFSRFTSFLASGTQLTSVPICASNLFVA